MFAVSKKKLGHVPIGCSIVTEIGHEVVDHFPKYVHSDAANIGSDLLIGFNHELVEIVKCQMLSQHTMTKPVALHQGVQLHHSSEGLWMKPLDCSIQRL